MGYIRGVRLRLISARNSKMDGGGMPRESERESERLCVRVCSSLSGGFMAERAFRILRRRGFSSC